MKAEAPALGFVLNIVITFLMISYAYLWGMNMYENILEVGRIDQSQKLLCDVGERIMQIWKYGGKEYVSFDIPATFEVKVNSTDEFSNFIEMRVPLRAPKNSSWIYLNSFLFEKYSSSPFRVPYVLRMKYEGRKAVLQLLFTAYCKGSECTAVLLKPSTNRICSNRCKIYLEKGENGKRIVGGKTIHYSKIMVGVEWC